MREYTECRQCGEMKRSGWGNGIWFRCNACYDANQKHNELIRALKSKEQSNESN